LRLKLRRVHSLLQILDLKIKRPAKYISHGTSRASGSDAASRKVSSIRERAGDCIDGTGISMSVLPLTHRSSMLLFVYQRFCIALDFPFSIEARDWSRFKGSCKDITI